MTVRSASRYVAYYRVSTAQQGASGLGLEAQKEAVKRYLTAGGWPPLQEFEEFEEVETGKGANAIDKRPALRAALEYARKHKATLVIAKLDRLSRNVAFISALMESKVNFVAVDNPHATRLTLHILAAFAEHEREMISERTKAALARSTKRLGANGAVQGKVLAAANKKAALAALEPVADRLRVMQAEGLTVRKIAATLNEEGVPSPGGGKWAVSNTHKALARVRAASEIISGHGTDL